MKHSGRDTEFAEDAHFWPEDPSEEQLQSWVKSDEEIRGFITDLKYSILELINRSYKDYFEKIDRRVF